MKSFQTLKFSILICFINCVSAGLKSGRLYAKTLSVSNGGPWGSWQYKDFCALGSYAIGFEMKIEERQRRGDDTSLNGIRLICGSASGVPDGTYASSTSAPWGDWKGEVRCIHGQVISGFQLQVEGVQRGGDDTSANFMRIRCRNLGTSTGENERYMGSGYGYWGTYGAWSKSCAANTAVCGIRTKIEGPQGRGDDTALNDLELYCCGNGTGGGEKAEPQTRPISRPWVSQRFNRHKPGHQRRFPDDLLTPEQMEHRFNHPL